MQNISAALASYVVDTRHLDSQPTSTEPTFYPAIKTLLSAILKEGRLPFEVRVSTSETKGKTRDMPDFVLGDDKMFVGVYGEVKRANVLLEDLKAGGPATKKGRIQSAAGPLRPLSEGASLRSPYPQTEAFRFMLSWGSLSLGA